jgi:lipoate-protein ligase A
VQGPGCLSYTLVLDRETRHEVLGTIASTNEHVLGRVIAALEACGVEGAAIQGTSDLTVGALKFSGNSQRRRKRFILFHGTILYGFDLDLISRCLGTPEKMPEYRGERGHERFVTNVAVDPARLRAELAREWGAEDVLEDWPRERGAELAAGRYRDEEWFRSI